MGDGRGKDPLRSNPDLSLPLAWKPVEPRRRLSLSTFHLGAILITCLAFGLLFRFHSIAASVRYHITGKQAPTFVLPNAPFSPLKDTAYTAKIFVYPLPDHLSKNIREVGYIEEWLNNGGQIEYEADVWVYQAIVNSSLQTMNPDEATLFYIPIFATRMLHQNIGGRPWHETVALSADYVTEAIHYVSQHWPYWNQTQGRNHFTTFTADDGRCVHFDGLDPELFAKMFVIQHHGDLNDYGREEEWPCYMPDRDILIPSYVPSYQVPVSRVSATLRPITALYRFDTEARTSWTPYHHSLVRPQLEMLYNKQPYPMSDWQLRDLKHTMQDMSHAVTTITPVGIVGHTSRYYRAIRKGSIPVSFFRSYDLPFQNVLDYSKFTINIQPSSIDDINVELEAIFSDPARLKGLQEALSGVQDSLTRWEIDERPRGVQKMLYDALEMRSRQFEHRKRVVVSLENRLATFEGQSVF